MNHIMLSLIVASAVGTAAFAGDEAESFNEIFTKAHVGGEFRAIYQSNSKFDRLDGTSGSSHTGVIGGKVELATSAYKGFDAVITGYGTMKVGANRNQSDGDYLNNGKDNGNYALLGQAFLRYTNGDSFIQAGRFELDTPLLNSDDIRMVPDLYQGVYGALVPVEDIRLEAGYIDRMAGWENGGDNGKFENIGILIGGNGKSNITFAGLSYGNEESPYSVRIFDYLTKNVMNQVYVDMGTNIEALTLQGQYLRSIADSKLDSFMVTATIDSTVWGLSAGIKSEETNLGLNLSYNESEAKPSTLFNGGTPDFFGGANDPFYTSMDVLTMHKMGDAKAYKAELTYDPSEILALSLAHAHFKKEDGFYNHESDLSATYTIQESISLEGMVSNVVVTDNLGKITDNRVRLALKVGF